MKKKCSRFSHSCLRYLLLFVYFSAPAPAPVCPVMDHISSYVTFLDANNNQVFLPGVPPIQGNKPCVDISSFPARLVGYCPLLPPVRSLNKNKIPLNNSKIILNNSKISLNSKIPLNNSKITLNNRNLIHPAPCPGNHYCMINQLQVMTVCSLVLQSNHSYSLYFK